MLPESKIAMLGLNELTYCIAVFSASFCKQTMLTAGPQTGHKCQVSHQSLDYLHVSVIEINDLLTNLSGLSW
jgi:hypothetical protein